MFSQVPVIETLELNHSKLTLQTGLLARQADSAIMATLGDTTILAAVVVGKETSADYFPLQVVYEERLYASGKIKGSRFIKREGKPSENAVLVGRMVDRSLRSLFDKNCRHEVQVVITILSVDEIHPPDTLSVLAASTALKIATKDFLGPVSSVRVGRVKKAAEEVLVDKVLEKIEKSSDFSEFKNEITEVCQVLELHDDWQKSLFKLVFDKLVAKNPDWASQIKSIYQSESRKGREGTLGKYSAKEMLLSMPTYQEMQNSDLDLVVSGDGENIMMVEAGANIVDESVLGQGLELASRDLKKLTEFQDGFIHKVRELLGVEPKELAKKVSDPEFAEYWSKYKDGLEEILFSTLNKSEKSKNLDKFTSTHFDQLSILSDAVSRSDISLEEALNEVDILPEIIQNQIELYKKFGSISAIESGLKTALEKTIHKLVRENILENDKRLDGRRLDKTRQIMCQVGVLPVTHGSSVFQRGETQVLNVATLGTSRDAQLLDDMEDFEEQTKRYIHHYNFPSYSVGEVGRYFGPGRREIGHGALAEKALLPVLPSEEEFPYTIRLVSECLGSNGSTSMASTCSSCLSLMDAGVPIKDMVAGVAMGLILDSQSGNFKVLTDIQGSEDHYGDMDFKVTGTKDGVTALQLDNKVAGLTVEILKKALVQAKDGRMHILNIMQQTISEPRPEISSTAPGVKSIHIPFDKIGDVIGPSGKTIKAIIAKYGVDIDIEDNTGKTFVYGKDRGSVAGAVEEILKLSKEYQPGDEVKAKVFRIESYGAFVKIDDTDKEGMIHISQMSEKRIAKVTDVIQMGQELTAKVLEINEKGQISLGLK